MFLYLLLRIAGNAILLSLNYCIPGIFFKIFNRKEREVKYYAANSLRMGMILVVLLLLSAIGLTGCGSCE